jgi:hypothetical protein
LRAVSAARDVTVDVNADEVEDRILCGTNFHLRRGVTTRASNNDTTNALAKPSSIIGGSSASNGLLDRV